MTDARRRFGEAGRCWAEELPALLRRAAETWRLTRCVAIEPPSINFVATAWSETWGDVVLKVEAPHEVRYTEIEALGLFAGRRCCPLLAVDYPSAALLLRRLRPGTTLRALASRQRQLEIGAEMAATLPVALTVPHGLPRYRDWLDGVRRTSSMEPVAGAVLQDLLGIATVYLSEIEAGGGPEVLLHGDLHHDNILASGSDWLAVDPQGVVGPALLEAGRFIQNHLVPDGGEIDPGEADRTIGCFADALAQSRVLVAKGFFVLSVLSVLWDREMRAAEAKIETQTRQCAQILRMIEGGMMA